MVHHAQETTYVKWREILALTTSSMDWASCYRSTYLVHHTSLFGILSTALLSLLRVLSCDFYGQGMNKYLFNPDKTPMTDQRMISSKSSVGSRESWWMKAWVNVCCWHELAIQGPQSLIEEWQSSPSEVSLRDTAKPSSGPSVEVDGVYRICLP